MSEQEMVTVKSECSECGGTGIYVGIACHDGAGVVCCHCEGKGFIEISYKPFTCRKTREGIKRVFLPEKYKTFYPTDRTENGKTVKYSEFGCTFEEWQKGKSPKPWC